MLFFIVVCYSWKGRIHWWLCTPWCSSCVAPRYFVLSLANLVVVLSSQHVVDNGSVHIPTGCINSGEVQWKVLYTLTMGPVTWASLLHSHYKPWVWVWMSSYQVSAKHVHNRIHPLIILENTILLCSNLV